ncbi:cation-translocating P-type ATPase [Halobacillus sp. BBL2006]|uniref:heavy metal translocating P-type ATPase n=1 Tax=Halobacillus sp. BBL2006 TaxID=1543706 RepID=UPI0005436A85|nr:cation-translocating P-type ATPase [Halobacillus sp. BBL2006]KHE71006.1 cadmium transporter [Halobacillus sp. BBL2006]
MKEYKLQGLSCANCAAEMESEIKKLDHGEQSQLKFGSSKLMVNEDVDLERVRQILKSDGASLVEEEGHEHTHDHSHGPNMKLLVILSGMIFGLTFIVESMVPSFVVIAMYLIAMGISGYQTFLKGAKNLIRFKFNIDTLMTIALVGAIAIGEWREATMVAILFGLNEYLEGLGMEKARNSMEKLLKVAPKQATLLRENGTEVVVSIESLQKDDVVLVKAGEKIPSDGIVIEGFSSVNEAAITGESLPVEKAPGETLYGGSINNEGLIKVKIAKAYQDSSLAKILHLVEEAQDRKTPTELFINRFAKYYTPIIMVISGLVMVAPPLFTSASWGASFYQGLAVLIVGCPCALILSSPIAIIAGITRNARNGILIKGGVFLEQLGKIESIAFDKTGTLTKGEPTVQETKVYHDDFYKIAGSIEKSSSHPIAKAVMKEVETIQQALVEPTAVNAIPGKGIHAEIEDSMYYIGSEQTISHLTISEGQSQDIEGLKEEGYTLVIVSSDEEVLGVFGIADEIREESATLIKDLHKAGIQKTIMLTGDHEKTARKVAEKIGVTDVYADLLPDQKVDQVKALSRSRKLAMVGDGINDAPALATADLGVAMGKGTDSAIETADIVLMQDHLGKLPSAVKIAKQVNRVVKLNISLALGLKLFALLLTIPGWLTLWVAILSDMGATILVTLISLTVLWQKPGAQTEAINEEGEVQPSA